MSSENLTVTIMAAGEGKRMNSNIPKVLHLFKGKPMLVRIILEVFKLNASKIIVITGKYHNLIKETLDKYFQNNIINYVQQYNPCGTGDAIKCTLDYYTNNENVLILNGDMPLITSNLLKKFIEEYNYNSNKIMVAKLDNPFGYGRIIYDNENNFIGIKEEKDCSIEEKNIKITNVGIYYFHSTVLQRYIPLINNNNNQKEYYLTDIIKVIKESNTMNLSKRSRDKELFSGTIVEENIDNIKTYCIDDNLIYQIMGVNTQEELANLEKSL
jgi:UDP-N-acetylglucosamine diphosphorylase/glucosamine-1-phosphate N-acetyltransferase